MKKILQILRTPTAVAIVMGVLGGGTISTLLPGEDHIEDYDELVERLEDQEKSLADLRAWFDLHVETQVR